MRRTVPAVHPRQAITLVIAAVACFAVLDSTIKVLSTAVPLVMAMWVRYLFQALSTTLVLLPGRGRVLLRTHHPYLQVTRGALLLGCSSFAFLSLQHMPVGEFTAILMLTPLLITLLAAHALGERVSSLRWALVLGGFAGALIIIRPGGDMLGWAALYPVGVVLTNAAFQILTSRLARTDDPGTMHFYTGWVGALSMSCLLPWAWQAAGPSTWALLGLAALLSSLGHVLLIQGYRRAPAATLTPFLYFQIAFATLAGWLYFNHAPDLATWLGMFIIAGCGAVGTFLSAHEEGRKRKA